MSYVNKTLTALPFEHIIGSPLKAAIEAQSLAAKATVDFIQQVGFTAVEPYTEGGKVAEIKKKPDFGEVRNIIFKYTATNEDGTQRVAELSVPILTIIPIPYLRIDDMTIDFTANITEVMESQKEFTRTSNKDGGVKAVVPFWIPARVGFKASVSSSRSSSSSSRYKTEYNMNIHLTAVQDDMPAGLSKVLNILESSIKESPTVGTGTETSLDLTFTAETPTVAGEVTTYTKHEGVSILLVGHSATPEETTANGIVTFTEVPYGIYTIQVNDGEYQFTESITVAKGVSSKTIRYDKPV